MFRRAAIYDGDKLIRPATGTTTRDFTPDEMEARRRSEFVSLRLDRPVLEHFQATGPDWRDRINDVLRRIVDSAA